MYTLVFAIISTKVSIPFDPKEAVNQAIPKSTESGKAGHDVEY